MKLPILNWFDNTNFSFSAEFAKFTCLANHPLIHWFSKYVYKYFSTVEYDLGTFIVLFWKIFLSYFYFSMIIILGIFLEQKTMIFFLKESWSVCKWNLKMQNELNWQIFLFSIFFFVFQNASTLYALFDITGAK